MRVSKIKIIILALFLILILRLAYLQAVKGNFYYSLSNKNCIRVIPAGGARGKILDHSGEPIADNQISYCISILPIEFRQSKETISKLSALIGMRTEQINKIIKNNLISSFTPIMLEKGVDKRTAFLIEENKLDLPGVIVQVLPARSYPYQSAAAHLLGYLGEIDRWRITRLKDYGYKIKDIIGFGGIEERLERVLRGREGGVQIQVDHRGRAVRTLGFRASAAGEDVFLTIDIKIQKIIEDGFAGRKGAAVLMEADTGKIIALVSSPGFYPGAFLDAESSDYIKGILSNSDAPLLNRAVSGQYPFGSVFKIISTVAALEKKKITPEKRFFCPGMLMVGLKEYNCWSRHDSQDLREAIAHSCNVYFYHLALMLGVDSLSEYALKFGLGRPAGIDLPYEVSGNVPSMLARRMKLQNWYDGDTANFGIGQGDLLVSPVQAVRFMSAIANGGRLVTPYLIGRAAGKDSSPKPPIHLGIDRKSLQIAIEGMKQVVNLDTGTANIGGWEGLKVAGKTGTAQVHNKLSHGWFVGFFPYDKPKIAFCFFLENTGPSIHAVILAQQVFNRMKEDNLI